MTTRFHPEPQDLLDFTTQFDVDPTHITLLNKDVPALPVRARGLPRAGRTSRQRMDWADKGRVLVYERRRR